MNLQQIDSILFDLGAVLLDIAPERAITAFKKAGIENFDKQYTLTKQSGLMDELETGKITPEVFYEKLREMTYSQIPDSEIRACWNELILPFRKSTFELLTSLRQHYKLYLLSNTNLIHYQYYTADFRQQFDTEFDSMFTKAYYSFDIGMRKPDTEIFRYVIKDSGIVAERCLFIDDNSENTKSASLIGLQTLHKTESVNLQRFFEDFQAKSKPG